MKRFLLVFCLLAAFSLPVAAADKGDIAPDFAGITHWLNSDPLTMQQLRGKVVLIDFWTYSCINCIRTLPYVTKWYDTYKDKGLVVIGVHTPEFPFERETSNVETAIKHFHINYPVAQDNAFGTWNAYANKYWPAEYLIDQQGKIVRTHFGEGEYDEMEAAIQTLLNTKQSLVADKGADLTHIGSPEMYFGLARQEYQVEAQHPQAGAETYKLPDSVAVNHYALGGKWTLDDDKATLMDAKGTIRLKFNSAKLHMVAASPKPITIGVIVDGKKQPDVTVSTSQLYTLFDSTDYKEHSVDITIPDAGFQAFTFTFG